MHIGHKTGVIVPNNSFPTELKRQSPFAVSFTRINPFGNSGLLIYLDVQEENVKEGDLLRQCSHCIILLMARYKQLAPLMYSAGK